MLKAQKNSYLQDILDEPAALQRWLDSTISMDYASLHQIRAKLSSGKLRRVILTGMGSSYHALHSIWLPLLNQGISAVLLETSELLHHAPVLCEPGSLLVVVSQSGRSAEVVRLLEQTDRNTTVIGVTNTADSPLAQRAQVVLPLQAGAEFSVSCKTYVNTLGALALLAELLTTADLQRTRKEILPVPEMINAYLAQWQAHVAEAQESLAGIRYLILTGRGTSLAAAGTGGLTIKESAHFPTEGMSSAAFRHGPLEMASPELFVLVFSGMGAGRRLNQKLVEDISAAGGKSALVGASGNPGIFCLPQVAMSALPLLEILPVQMVSLALAGLSGREAGLFSQCSKLTDVE
jgi:glucosamine--fructose-6-phosphate aminotransferase (isomerizing)